MIDGVLAPALVSCLGGVGWVMFCGGGCGMERGDGALRLERAAPGAASTFDCVLGACMPIMGIWLPIRGGAPNGWPSILGAARKPPPDGGGGIGGGAIGPRGGCNCEGCAGSEGSDGEEPTWLFGGCRGIMAGGCIPVACWVEGPLSVAARGTNLVPSDGGGAVGGSCNGGVGAEGGGARGVTVGGARDVTSGGGTVDDGV